MKYLISILVLSVIATSSFSQKKRKGVKEIKTDTVCVFDQLEEEFFSEKNVYWPEKGEMTLIYTQFFKSSDWDGGRMINFSIVFYHWDSIQINRIYDLKNFLVDCEIEEIFGGENFETPTGKIIFRGKKDNRLIFELEAQALSKDRRKLLIFRGVREFVPDY